MNSEKQGREYDNLRAEILHLDSQNYRIVAVVGAAFAGILTAAVSQTELYARAAIAGCVYVVTYLASELLQVNRQQI